MNFQLKIWDITSSVHVCIQNKSLAICEHLNSLLKEIQCKFIIQIIKNNEAVLKLLAKSILLK